MGVAVTGALTTNKKCCPIRGDEADGIFIFRRVSDLESDRTTATVALEQKFSQVVIGITVGRDPRTSELEFEAATT